MDGGVGVLGQDAGLTELFPVSPQVMETRQVPRSFRVRLLLLLLLLVPWGIRTASGVALPPAGVFRFVRRPGLPGRGGNLERWEETQGERGTETQKEGQRPRERRTETRGEERQGMGRKSAGERDSKRFREKRSET